MDLELVNNLVEIFKNNSMKKFSVKKGDVEIHMEKGDSNNSLSSTKEYLIEEHNIDLKKMINSPIVGTFYRKPSASSDPYINIGDEVKKGDTICIVEAMKVMNEIKADQNCRIKEILVQDGMPVSYGESLFVME